MVQIVRRLFDHLEEWLSAALLATMSLAIFLGVLTRYVFRFPLSWAEELSRFSFIWLVFIGASLVVKRSHHITIELIPSWAPGPIRRALRTAGVLLVVGALVILIWSGTSLAISAWGTPTSMLNIPWGLVYLAVPLGSLLSLMRIAQRSLNGQPPAQQPEGGS